MNGIVQKGLGAALVVGAVTLTVSAPLTQSASAVGTWQDQDRLQELLNEAAAHMEAGRWRQAVDSYTAALAIDGGNQAAMDGLQDARAQLDVGSALQDVDEMQELQRQQTLAEFNDSFARAQQLLNEKDFATARNEILTARIKLSRNRQVLSESEFDRLNRQAGDLIDQIDDAEEIQRAADAAAQDELIRKQRMEEENRQRAERAAHHL